MTEQYRYDVSDEEIFFYLGAYAKRYDAESNATNQNLKDEYFYRSVKEADRLGYEVMPGRHEQNPIVAISETTDDTGKAKELATRFGLKWDEANAAWHVLDQRRDGDAIVALIGSRHANGFWYTVVVAWSPEQLAKRLWEGERLGGQGTGNGGIWMTTGLM